MTEAQMQLAHWLAEAASTLDFGKNGLPAPLRLQAIGVCHDMHELAAALAEDRVDEVYAPEDGRE